MTIYFTATYGTSLEKKINYVLSGILHVLHWYIIDLTTTTDAYVTQPPKYRQVFENPYISIFIL